MHLRKNVFVRIVSSLLVLIFGTVTAQISPAVSNRKKPGPELQGAIHDTIQHHKELESIKAQTLANNPELKQEWQDFQQAVKEKISSAIPAGASNEEKIQARKKVQKDLRNDKDVMKQARQLRSQFKDAMREVNPDVENVLKNLESSMKKVQDMGGGPSLMAAPGYGYSSCRENVSSYQGCCGCCDDQWYICIVLLPGLSFFCDNIWEECLCMCFHTYIGSGECPI